MSHAALVTALRRAAAARRPLAEDARHTAFRYLHGEADGLPDVTIDGFGDVRIVSLYRAFTADEERTLLDAIAEVQSPRAVYLKRRPREARVVATTQKAALAPEAAASGEEVTSLEALENGLRFLIRPPHGLNVGLYLDMRDTRAWLMGEAKGRSVLNLFAYTCGFGIAAVAGGAARAVNVDASRRVLDWGEENAALNGQPVDRRDFIQGDAFDWLSRFARKGERFDLILLDPPSFSNTKGSRFSVEREYDRLVAAAAPLVSRGGLLVACCNHAGLSEARFDALIQKGLAQGGRRGAVVRKLGPSPLDFPVVRGEAPALKVRVLAL